jgi:hypothetical protein
MTSQNLKIATWNLDRPKTSAKLQNDLFLETLRSVDADILVLTETSSCIDLSEKYVPFPSASLFQSLSVGGEEYEQGENRVTVWTKLSGQRRVDMCNSHSAVCVQVVTSWGERLNIYGTVIGIYGKNRGRYESPTLSLSDFERTLDVQLADWERLAESGESLCIAGDFNLSLVGNYYATEVHRRRVLDCFQKLNIVVPTKELTESVDHIAIASRFMRPASYVAAPWPRHHSDHEGICLTLTRS